MTVVTNDILWSQEVSFCNISSSDLNRVSLTCNVSSNFAVELTSNMSFGRYHFLFVCKGAVFVKAGEGPVGGGEAEWLSAEVKPALLERHEARRREESVPAIGKGSLINN